MAIFTIITVECPLPPATSTALNTGVQPLYVDVWGTQHRPLGLAVVTGREQGGTAAKRMGEGARYSGTWGRTWDKGLPLPTSGSLTLSPKKLATCVLTPGPEDRSPSGHLKESPTFQGTWELWPSGSWRGAGRAQLSKTRVASQKEVPALRRHQCSGTPGCQSCQGKKASEGNPPFMGHCLAVSGEIPEGKLV